MSYHGDVVNGKKVTKGTDLEENIEIQKDIDLNKENKMS